MAEETVPGTFLDKGAITRNWLPRYTGMPLEEFGEYILLTNFGHYVETFAERFGCPVFIAN